MWKPQQKVIVRIPSYNEEAKMPQIIKSFSSQTVSSLKLVLHDDASTDGTVKKFASCAARAGLNFKTDINPVNVGLVRNFRKIFLSAPAESPYFLFASNHEDYLPTHTEALTSEIRNENTALVYSDSYLRCDKTGRFVADFQAPDLSTSGLTRVEAFEKVLNNYTYANPLWGLYNSRLVAKAPPFPHGRGGDHAFVAGIALAGEIIFHREKTWTRFRNQTRTGIDFATLESATSETKEVEEIAKWPWLGFFQAHYEVIANSDISNIEKQKCLQNLISGCLRLSNDNLAVEVEKIFNAKNKPVHLMLVSLILRSLIR